MPNPYNPWSQPGYQPSNNFPRTGQQEPRNPFAPMGDPGPSFGFADAWDSLLNANQSRMSPETQKIMDRDYSFSGLPRRAAELAYEHVAQPAMGYIASWFNNQQNPWAQAGTAQPDAITKASPWGNDIWR